MKQLLFRLKKFNHCFVLFEKAVLMLLLFSMIGLSFGQVVARNLFSVGFIWVDQILRLEVLWVAFIGAALATEYNQHIKIDFLLNLVRSDGAKKYIGIGGHLFALIVCCLLFIVASDYIRIVSGDVTSTIIHGVPDWYFQSVIPYCFFFAFIRSFINILKRYYDDDINP